MKRVKCEVCGQPILLNLEILASAAADEVTRFDCPYCQRTLEAAYIDTQGRSELVCVASQTIQATAGQLIHFRGPIEFQGGDE